MIEAKIYVTQIWYSLKFLVMAISCVLWINLKRALVLLWNPLLYIAFDFTFDPFYCESILNTLSVDWSPEKMTCPPSADPDLSRYYTGPPNPLTSIQAPQNVHFRPPLLSSVQSANIFSSQPAKAHLWPTSCRQWQIKTNTDFLPHEIMVVWT